MVELFAGVHRTLGVRCSPDKLEMVAQVCHPSTPEEEAGRLRVILRDIGSSRPVCAAGDPVSKGSN